MDFPSPDSKTTNPIGGSIRTGRGEAQTTNTIERKKCDGSMPKKENIRKKKSLLATALPVPAPGQPTRIHLQRNSDWWPEWLDLHCRVGGGGVALSAALTYEEALVDGGAKRTEYWTYQRVMEKSFSGRRSIVAYHTLPFMRAGRRPAGWDKWGRPWALMDIAQELIPHDGKVWHQAHTPRWVLVAVLVRHDEEPYYFPDAPTLLRTLHQNAKAEGDVTAQPGAQGWSARELKQVETLLRPHTYPPCGAVTSCLRRWTQVAHRGEGYHEGPAMPGGPDLVAFHTECWDYPELIVPLMVAGPQKERPAEKESQTPEEPKVDSGSGETLREKWQATHDMDPPAWADKGFAGIKEHMQQQAETAGEKGAGTVTIYSPPSGWTPRQQLRAFLDPQLPGVQVPADQAWKYEDDQAIPDHALPRFRGNPKSHFPVMSPVPEYLRGYWTKEHQSPVGKATVRGISELRRAVSRRSFKDMLPWPPTA